MFEIGDEAYLVVGMPGPDIAKVKILKIKNEQAYVVDKSFKRHIYVWTSLESLTPVFKPKHNKHYEGEY